VTMAAEGMFALRSARLLNVDSGRYESGAAVLVSGGNVQTVGRVPDGVRVIDLGERVLMPGLIDAHTHIFLQGNTRHQDFRDQILREYPSHRVARAVRSLKIALQHGFTWLRDLGTEGAGYDDVGLKLAIAEGVIDGPSLQVAGPALTATGTYPIIGFRPDWRFPSGVETVDGLEHGRRAVREQLSYGVDWIKVYTNSGAGSHLTPDGYIDSPTNWTQEELNAIVAEAHARGHRVAAHATSDAGVSAAIEAGVESIEHGYSIRPDAAARMAAQGIMLCATVTPARFVAEERGKERGRIWTDAPVVQVRSFENCLTAGVRVVFGTDAGGFPWTEINQAREFTYLAELGLPAIDCIRAATTVAAELMELGWEVGRIQPGARADFVAVPGDPLKDLSALERIDFVMKGGQVLHGPS
jgi:imidazolonepropionase-like amidohydrolase